MFHWLLALLARRDRHDTYLPRERAIYHYFDGVRVVHADPMVLYKRVMSRAVVLEQDWKLSRSESKGAELAADSLYRTVRETFGLPLAKGPDGLDVGGTLTREECGELLEHFLAYVADVKKNSMTWRPASIPSGNSGNGLAATSITSSSSDFGSTEGDLPYALPLPSAKESSTPTEPLPQA